MANILGEYLRDLRIKRRFSLREIAGEAKMSPSYLSQVETGVRQPSADILRKIAPAYNVPVKDLLEVAGYLDQPEATMTDEQRMEWAFQCVITDPDYGFGTRLRGTQLTLDAKRFIVEVYQKATGKRLL